MITCYFGVPGVGKSTVLTKIAQTELKKIKKNKSKYTRVYTNFYCKGCNIIQYEDLATYLIEDSLILLDELTLDADNRNFKSFKSTIRDFFILHRHLNCDIVYATQSYEMVDLKIRQLTADLWYMTKTVVPFFDRFTQCKKIYRNININEYTSELTLGYRFCNFLESLFTSNYKLCYRPKYYKYFDSFDQSVLADRPTLDTLTWDTKNQHSFFADDYEVSATKNESPSECEVYSPVTLTKVESKAIRSIPRKETNN